MVRDELAAFDPDLLAGGDLPQRRLETLARAHQAGVRELPGVDDIVYEWRNGLPRDPLVHRSPSTYVLVLPERVWEEFLDHLDAGEEEGAALKRLHARQARRLLDSPDPLAAGAAMVLVRP